MENEKKDFRSNELKKRVKILMEKSKKLKLIKPHTLAFKENPTEVEEHKGKLIAYRK